MTHEVVPQNLLQNPSGFPLDPSIYCVSAENSLIAQKYERLLEGRSPEPLGMLPPYFKLILAKDFPDPDVWGNFYFATQSNLKKGDIQRAVKIGDRIVPDDKPVLGEKPNWWDIEDPQAWAPCLWQNGNKTEMWFSAKVKGSGMGIVRAEADNPLGIFNIKDLQIHGGGFRFIDAELSHENILIPGEAETDFAYYGSMFGPIVAQPVGPDRKFNGPPIEVLKAGENGTLARLVEAPIRLDAGGESFLFVSGCGCFSRNPATQEHYAVLQTKYNNKTRMFEYMGANRTDYLDSLLLGSTPWFYNAGHPKIYREKSDNENEATCVFAAIPWYRLKSESDSDPATPNNQVRYMFKCKLKLEGGRWGVDTANSQFNLGVS
jgi:hypothetical protein